MTVVCYGASTMTITVVMAPTSIGLAVALDHHYPALKPPMTPRDTMRALVDLTTMPQQ